MPAPGPGDAIVAPMEAARALIAALQRPGAYPHAVGEPIRVAETHISWVVLTGEFAYKVKKPVKLSFLDYSTLERRHRLCEEELRLNRRLAPDLYLGVSAIGGSPGTPRVDGTGPALEYAVRMRQFSPADELSALLAARTVTPDDIAALGAGIARFHAAAAPAPAGSDYGRAETAHRVTMDNFAELRALPEAAGWASRLSALESRISALHGELRPLMTERRQRGRVRECHGDLHCGNVVRWAGALTPFDGIEFEPALRFIDVINDIAFLTMDLAERGHLDLRRAVLQAWADTSGDWTGLSLLPYYEAYRALVRAKVAALRALQLETGSPARAAAVTDCRRYLDWAAARVAGRRPMLLITCGLSGSGKTWLARRLAAHLGALHLRSDVERKRLAGLAAHEDSRSPPDAGIYTLAFNEHTYGRLRECAAAALAAGELVIVDAAFLRSHERQSFLALARERSVPFAILHCHAPEAVLRDRVSARAASGSDASEAGLDVLARQPSYWEAFGGDEQRHVVDVDTSDTSAVAAATAALATLTVR
jgi:aminoglycoside phosphotransferase family enzyme/predicted kinase